MNINFSRLWKKGENGKWQALSDLTNGGWQIRQPGSYKTNQKSNGWWGEPSEFEITKEELAKETYVDGFGNTRIGHYGGGIYISA